MSNHKPLRIFYSYAPQDEKQRQKLENHLAMLRRNGVIQEWHDRMIQAGIDREQSIDTNLEAADIVLLLVSADFLASDYRYEKEIARALERHYAGEAVVIPILIHPVDWRGALFNELPVLPTNAKPVTSWSNQNEAWMNVAQGILQAIKRIEGNTLTVDGKDHNFKEQDTRKDGLIFSSISIDSNNEYWYESFEPLMTFESIISSLGPEKAFYSIASLKMMSFLINSEYPPSTNKYFLQRWHDHVFIREYPFIPLCAQNFYLADFVVGVGPSFDVTLLNREKQPIILNSIGIEIISAARVLYSYGFPKSVKLLVNDCYSIDMSEIYNDVNAKLKENTLVDLRFVVPTRMPDPIYLPAGAPYRYKLFLQNYDMLPNNLILRMWIRTDRGEKMSQSLYLFTL